MSDLSRMEDKLDAIARDITAIKVTQAIQAKDLVHHIKRTDTLQKQVEWNRRLMYIYIACAGAVLGPQMPRLLELLQVLLK